MGMESMNKMQKVIKPEFGALKNLPRAPKIVPQMLGFPTYKIDLKI